MIKNEFFLAHKRRLILSLGCFAAFVIVVLAGMMVLYPGQQAVLSSQGSEVSASLSGFKPDTGIEYAVLVPGQDILTGKAAVDQNGVFEVPAYDISKLNRDAAVTYNIRIDDEQKPVTVNFKIIPGQGKISSSGRGLNQFSDIVIEQRDSETVKGRFQTKADWAGVFAQDGQSDFDLFGSDHEYRLVMYDTIETDAQHQSPYMIKIYSAPGGGGRTSSRVNRFTSSACGQYPLSFCDTGKVRQQNDTVEQNYVGAFMRMAQQFSAVMMQQVAIVGTFFDAKQQLETQQELQKLQAEAVKDYHPDAQMCQFGSFVKSVAKTEEKAAFDKLALNAILMNAYVNKEHGSTSEGAPLDVRARIKQFREVYCDPKDNNDGLANMCDHDQKYGEGDVGASDAERMNKDIDFARTIDAPMTLDIDFTNPDLSDDEEDVIALARQLYWPDALASTNKDNLSNFYSEYMNARQVMAIQSVAHNSFTEIVALKSKSAPNDPTDTEGTAFMKSLMREFGLTDEEIDQMLGEFPSYYAQMEVLTKKTYQAPSFYTNLYTKPANIGRIGTSLEAIKIMQGRDHYEAALRKEMLTSLMVEEALAKHQESVTEQINSESAKF